MQAFLNLLPIIFMVSAVIIVPALLYYVYMLRDKK